MRMPLVEAGDSIVEQGSVRDAMFVITSYGIRRNLVATRLWI